MKTIETHLGEKEPERVEIFKKAAQLYAKKIITNFKDYDLVRSIRLRLSESTEAVFSSSATP
jgi:hypothetical protein